MQKNVKILVLLAPQKPKIFARLRRAFLHSLTPQTQNVRAPAERSRTMVRAENIMRPLFWQSLTIMEWLTQMTNFMIILHFSCNSNNYYIFVTARNNRKRREVLKENGTKIPRSYPVWISQCLRATKQRSYYLQGRIAWPLRKFQCTVLQSSSQTKKKQEKNERKQHPKKEMTKRKQRKWCWGFSETPK